jgi:hypothetical protein
MVGGPGRRVWPGPQSPLESLPSPHWLSCQNLSEWKEEEYKQTHNYGGLITMGLLFLEASTGRDGIKAEPTQPL